MKEPSIYVTEYKRGTNIVSQDILDEDFTLTVDRSNYFSFKVDDIEKAHSHVNWMNITSDAASYALRDTYDTDVLHYIAGFKVVNGVSVPVSAADMPGTKAISTAGDDELLTSNKLIKGSFSSITTASAGNHSIPVAPRFPGQTGVSNSTVSPLQIFNRAGRVMDQQLVPKAGRWAVIDPVMEEMIRSEDSPLINMDWGKAGGIRNGMVTDAPIYGFRLYVSNNLPVVGTGPDTAGTANQNTNYGVIIFGHDGAVATAEQINKTEVVRGSDGFYDALRGLHLYGRKKLRSEAIVTAKYNTA